MTVLALGRKASGAVGKPKALDLTTMSIGFSKSTGLTGRLSGWLLVEATCWLIVVSVMSPNGVPRICDISGVAAAVGFGDGG